MFVSGEQGALSLLPLYMVDNKIGTNDVTFWTGIVGQATSIFGSFLGGCLLSQLKLVELFLIVDFSIGKYIN